MTDGRMMERAEVPHLVRNILWTFGGRTWPILIGFLTTPFIVHSLGTEAYGLLVTAGVLTNYMWCTDLGVGQATIKLMAEHTAREEREDISRVFWTSQVAMTAVGAVVAGALILLAPHFATRWFRIPPGLQVTAITVFSVTALYYFITMVNSAPGGVPRALQRFDVVNQISIAVMTAQPLLAVVLLLAGYSVIGIVTGNAVIVGISLLYYGVITRRLVPDLSGPTWHTPTFRKLMRLGGFFTVTAVITPILNDFEKLVLASQQSMSAMTYYTIPYSLSTKAWVVAGTFSTVLFPVFSSLDAKGRMDMSIDLNLRLSRYIMLIVLPITVLFLVLGEDLLTVWLGPEFARQSTTVLQILAVAMHVSAIAWNPLAFVQASGRADLTAKFHVAELIFYIPFSMACIRLWGIEGAAAAWFARVVVDTTLLWGATVRLTKFRWTTPLAELFNRGVWAMIGAGCILWMTRWLLRPHFSSWTILIGLGAAYLVVAVYAAWRWGMREDERMLVWQALRKK